MPAGLGHRAAKQEPQARDGRRGLRQPELRQRALSRRELRAIDQRHHASHLRGAHVREQPCAVLQRPRRPGQQFQLHVEHLRRPHALQRSRRDQRRPAGSVSHLHTGEVGGGALACAGLLHRSSMHLHAAHPHAAGSGAGAHQIDHVVRTDGSGEERSGDHGAEAFHRERVIERQEERPLLGPRRILLLLHRRGDGSDQLGEPLAGARRDLDDRAFLEEGAFHQLLQLEHQELAVIGAQPRKQVGLGQRDHAGAHAQQPQHVEVLGGLRHRAFVGGHAEHRHVDAAGGGDHRAQEALVAGNVDHAGGADPGQIEVRVPGFQRDAAALLLGQPIGVDPGERLHQRRLAVIDVAGGADDDAERASRRATHRPTPLPAPASRGRAQPRRAAPPPARRSRACSRAPPAGGCRSASARRTAAGRWLPPWGHSS